MKFQFSRKGNILVEGATRKNQQWWNWRSILNSKLEIVGRESQFFFYMSNFCGLYFSNSETFFQRFF